jgi:alanyl-tRNA synthetase
LIDELKKLEIPKTDDTPKYIYTAEDAKDVNAKYDFTMCSGKILAIIKDGKLVNSISSGESGGIILDKTCFYAEQGGQIYDTGVLTKSGDNVSL